MAAALAVVASGDSYVAVGLRDGREAWRIRWVTEYGVNASDPIVDGDRVFLSTGYGKGWLHADNAAKRLDVITADTTPFVGTLASSADDLQSILEDIDGFTIPTGSGAVQLEGESWQA